jgi:hypothetical protein
MTYIQIREALEDLQGRSLRRIKDIPMIDSILSDNAQTPLAQPFPKGNILIHDGRLELLFRLEVKDLNRPSLGPQGDYVSGPVHNSTVRVDGALDDLIVIFEVDYDNLWFVFVVEFLPNANEMIGF